MPRRAPPPGGQTGPPDFVGVGTLFARAPRWHDLLLQHPAIRPARDGRRALGFFDEFCAREMGEDDTAAYHGWFPRREGTITGEWSTRYMYDPWTPELLRRAAPDARLLVILSDPIERYRGRLGRGLAGGEPNEQRLHLYLSDAVGRGRYATQLRQLLAFFSRDRVLVLQTEKCWADPLGEYARTLRFLGVAADFAPQPVRQLAAVGTLAKPHVRALRALGVPDGLRERLRERLTGRRSVPRPAELWPDVEDALHAELVPEVEALRELAPEIDLALWPHFAHLASSRVAAPAGR